MNHHHLPAGPQILPALPLHPGRRPTDHYLPAPMPLPPRAPVNVYHPAMPSAQPYGPPHFRPYPPYPIPPYPPVPQYSHAPLIVSSYPHSQPPVPISYPLPPPPAPPPRLPLSPTHFRAIHSPAASEASAETNVIVGSAIEASSRSAIQPDVPTVVDFFPELPWYSNPDEPFPPKALRRRRRRKIAHTHTPSLELPQTQQDSPEPANQAPPPLAPSQTETPLTSQAPSELDSTRPTTPSSALPLPVVPAPAPSAHVKTASRQILPALPFFPDVQHHERRESSGTPSLTISQDGTPRMRTASINVTPNDSVEVSSLPKALTVSSASTPSVELEVQLPKPAPKSWADLVRSNAPAGKSAGSGSAAHGAQPTNGAVNGSTASLADLLLSFQVDGDSSAARRVSFLEPRGLVNTGNMCYMNSMEFVSFEADFNQVLQILIFCTPFSQFLERVGQHSKHSFKDNTPLLDGLILFLREFKVIDSASTPEQLKMRLKESELEEYGEAFIPDFLYDVIRRLPRFSSMRRGHQQDAEEFLGFLLEGLHDECVQVMRGLNPSAADSGFAASMDGAVPSSGIRSPDGPPTPMLGTDGGWQEVGPRQKIAVTHSSGDIVMESPVTKMFGGKLRSELRVPGLKNSVTLEPYQPLQLDIQSPHIANIIDALKGLTHPETLQGNFNSPRGPNTTATKQVFIETLPPVLILHLKRFHYDNAGGTQKIWKKVGYPLDLDIPKEVFPAYRRNSPMLQGTKYRLIGVVYHHGKNASVGHYTVDVRRQEGQEWIRLDDTVIRRIRSSDVSEGGAEEDQHRSEKSINGNMYSHVEPDDSSGEGAEDGWRQANGTGASGGKPEGKSDTVAQGPNGHSTHKQSVRDNKVAYLLFYQRV
ncbi:MAG: hypothetical protein M1826_002631 [Phylliscum demangeonii]|nr:MAG: hypothetical protein M1826_002631 [Phylliscum demangeonii]